MIDLPFFKKNQQAAASIRTIEELTQEELYENTKTNLRDLITPVGLEVNPSFLKFSGKLVKTLFILSYPKILSVGWLSPVVNLNQSVNVSIFFHPMDTEKVLKNLRKRATQLEAQMLEEQERGLVRNVLLETAISDIEGLRDSLVQGRDKMFYIAVYLTIIANTEEEMSQIENNLVSMFGQKMIDLKPAIFRQFEAYESNLPIGLDLLDTRTPLNIGPASTFFPFISSNLIQDDGIFYGMNMQNSTPVIFDRFSLENSNCVIFAKSGSGKSYFTKLDIIRHLMKGVDVIVVDPENEYKTLVDTVGGTYVNINLNSNERINPFDLPRALKDSETKPGDLLRGGVINLLGLMNLMLGKCTPSESAILEKAIITTYSLKGITMTDDDVVGKEIPIMKDLYSVLETMDGAKGICERLEKYVTGIFSGVFSEATNINLTDGLVVFSVRDLDDILRPIAMYMLLGYVWNVTRSSLRKRVLVVDEAWNIMQHEDSAKFLFGLVKRARKYGL